jgi:hypothetical protein
MALNNVNVQQAFEILTNPSYGGGVRPNRFTVEFSGFAQKIDSNRQYQVTSIDLPNLTIGTADYQYNSQPLLKVPYTRLPGQTITINFRVDRGGTLLKQLNDYLEHVIDPRGGNYFVKYLQDVYGEVIFKSHSSEDHKPKFELKFFTCVITDVGAASYSFEDRDSFQSQTVTFSYQDYEYKKL